MPHFDAGEWSDFVRGLVTGEKAVGMDRHRETCRACRRIVEVLSQVSVTGRADREQAPPDHLARWAQALFSQAQPAAGTGRATARLLFDSLAAPAAAGVRAHGRVSRHLLYEAGAFGLDLHLEYERGSPRVTLVGQVLDRRQPQRSLTDVTIRVVRGRTEVARTRCNRYGEFLLDYEPTGRLRLYVSEQRRNMRVEISLAGKEDESADGRP